MNEIGKNLKRIRLLNNLSLKKAGDLLNMSATAIAKYENGIIIPNSKKLIEFSKAYNVKVIDILKVHNTPEMKFTSFRKKQRLTGKNLDLLKGIIQNKVSDYLEVIDLCDINQLKLKKYSVNSLNDIEYSAEKFRRDYDLSINQPISNLINILENIGILIIQVENTNKKFSDFDGLSEIVNGIPIIVLLKDNDGARQRFTIAHELGHLLLDIKDKSINEEKACNKFAGALLMPVGAIVREFGLNRKNISIYELKVFKIEYKVSMSAIIYRLKELNIINEYLYKKINIIFNKNGIKKNEPISINPEESYQFKKLVHRLEIDNIITISKACSLLDITIDEYNKENYNN